MHKSNVALVTGGAGFIGSHIVDLLVDQGYKVRVIDNLVGGRLQNLEGHKNTDAVSVDERSICNIKEDDMAFKDVDLVFHMAGIGDIVPSIEKPVDYMETNVFGTLRVLEASRFSKVKSLVYAASSSCYGLTKDLPTKETTSISTQYPYALSKYQGEQLVFHWGKVYGQKVNSIRIFNAYGTRSRTSGAYGAVMGVFLKQKLAGEKFTVVGDGQQLRDFVYVTDVARAFFMVAKSERKNEVYNVGGGNPQSINKLVDLLGGDKVHIPKRPGEPDITFADISKISKDIGWNPSVSIEEGIAILLENINYWKNAPLWDEKSIKEATKTWFEYLS